MPESRHGKRAPGQTAVLISGEKALIDAAKAKARAEGKSLSGLVCEMLAAWMRGDVKVSE